MQSIISESNDMAINYEKAGVSLEAGYEVVRRIKQHVASTRRPGWMGGIGSFGGMFDLASLGYKEPVLVSGTDGVGTKLKIAFAMDKHDTIGIDAVAMCVNDVLAQGAEPLFFIDGTKVSVGDVLVGIASSGVHSNGFSLVRKIVSDAGLSLDQRCPELGGRVLGEVLLTPTNIYVKEVLEVIRRCNVHGVAHITGGGFDENIPRILRPGQGIEVHEGTWEILPVFQALEKWGRIPHREMFNIFNMGVGMVLALDAAEADAALAILAKAGRRASVIGRVTDTEGVNIILR